MSLFIMMKIFKSVALKNIYYCLHSSWHVFTNKQKNILLLIQSGAKFGFRITTFYSYTCVKTQMSIINTMGLEIFVP